CASMRLRSRACSQPLCYASILVLLWQRHLVQTGGRNKQSRCEPLSPSETHRFATSSRGMETVARAPGCPPKTFSVKFGSAPLSQEGHTMFGPGEYRPDSSAGITAPADLPQPEIVPYSRNVLRQSCPRCVHSVYRAKQSHRATH